MVNYWIQKYSTIEYRNILLSSTEILRKYYRLPLVAWSNTMLNIQIFNKWIQKYQNIEYRHIWMEEYWANYRLPLVAWYSFKLNIKIFNDWIPKYSSTDILSQLQVTPGCLIEHVVEYSNIQRLNNRIFEFRNIEPITGYPWLLGPVQCTQRGLWSCPHQNPGGCVSG